MLCCSALPSGAANPTRPQAFQEIANKNLGYMQTPHQLLQKWVYASARRGALRRKARQGVAPAALPAVSPSAGASSAAATSGSLASMPAMTVWNHSTHAMPARRHKHYSLLECDCV